MTCRKRDERFLYVRLPGCPNRVLCLLKVLRIMRSPWTMCGILPLYMVPSSSYSCICLPLSKRHKFRVLWFTTCTRSITIMFVQMCWKKLNRASQKLLKAQVTKIWHCFYKPSHISATSTFLRMFWSCSVSWKSRSSSGRFRVMNFTMPASNINFVSCEVTPLIYSMTCWKNSRKWLWTSWTRSKRNLVQGQTTSRNIHVHEVNGTWIVGWLIDMCPSWSILAWECRDSVFVHLAGKS